MSKKIKGLGERLMKHASTQRFLKNVFSSVPSRYAGLSAKIAAERKIKYPNYKTKEQQSPEQRKLQKYLSSFKLRSGNDMGNSATKLMKEAPLKEKLNSKKQLEDKVRGFFGSLEKGFQTAAEKRAAASAKRTKKIAEQKAKFTEKKKKFEDEVKKVISNKPTAVKGGTKAVRERAKKFKFF